MHKGATNVAIVFRNILREPVEVDMVDNVDVEDITMKKRHNGTQLFPFIDEEKEGVLEKYKSRKRWTRSLMLTWWSVGHAGTMYCSPYMIGTEPIDTNGIFYKVFAETPEGDAALFASKMAFVETPDHAHKALLHS